MGIYSPNWPVFAAPKLSKNTAAKIRAALLKLKTNTPESQKVLSAAKLTGFAMDNYGSQMVSE